MRTRVLQMLMIAVLVVPLAALAVIGRQTADRRTSKVELRALARNPRLSVDGLVSGRYFRDEDTYLSDQMPFRDTWVRGYMYLQLRILGKTALNRVVVGRDGQLLWDMTRQPVLTDEQIDQQIAASMDQFLTLNRLVSSYGGRFLYVGHPTPNSFLQAKYPVGFGFNTTFNRAKSKFYAALAQRGVDGLDLRPVFESHRKERLFFSTDHHWTAKGGYYAYSAIVRHLGLRPLDWDRDLRVRTLGPPFVGSLNRRVGLALPLDETVDIAELRDPIPYSKSSDGDADRRLYYMPADGESYSYYVFMNGDHAETVIDTNRPELPDVVFFGDSFTNAVEPLLWANFNTTRILDLRHYQGSLYEYVERYHPDYVVSLVRDEYYFVRAGNGCFSGASAGGAAAE